jgi:mono/diheme cytochrome c family protein
MKPNRAENTGKQSLSGRVLLRSGGVLLGVALLAALAPSISAPAGAQNPPPVTYTRDVAPILQAKCQECHRPGSIGPFSLLTYADAKARAKGIQEYTQRRIMPPWKAADGFGEFQDVRRLTDAQIQTIAHWVDVGAPEGDPKDLPPPRQFAEGWTLGTPDLVLDAGEPFEVPAREGDLYRNFVLPFYSQDDQWLSAVEFSPGSAEVVHHVVLLLDPQGKSPALDKAEPEPGFTVIGFTAGFSPALWLEGWAPGATTALPPRRHRLEAPRPLASGDAGPLPLPRAGGEGSHPHRAALRQRAHRQAGARQWGPGQLELSDSPG